MQHPYTSSSANPSNSVHLPLPSYSPPISFTSRRSFSGTSSFPPSPALTPRSGSPPASDAGLDSILLEQQPLFLDSTTSNLAGCSDRHTSQARITALEGSEEKFLTDNRAAPFQTNANRGMKRRRWVIVVAVLAGVAVVVIAAIVAVKLIKHSAHHGSSAAAAASTSFVASQPTHTAIVTTTPTLTGNWPQGWTQNMVFPTGFPGTGKNGLIGSSTRASSATSGGQYAQLLAFGSSYSDNGHPREAKYAGSNSPPGYYQGRWSNGPVWDEYLRDMLGNKTNAPLELLNFAYGGATTNNSIHDSGVPDTGMQIGTYLAQNDPQRNHKALVTTFTSTNDITMELSFMASPSNPNPRNVTAALASATRSAQSLINQLSWLIPPTSQKGAVAPDFLVLPIVPLEEVSRAQYLARKGDMDISVIKQLVQTYNSVLMDGLDYLAKTLGDRGNVYTYDIPSLVYSVIADSQQYGITNATAGCFYTHCTNPEQHMFWDNLHLVTSFQKNIATIVSEIVLPST